MGNENGDIKNKEKVKKTYKDVNDKNKSFDENLLNNNQKLLFKEKEKK